MKKSKSKIKTSAGSKIFTFINALILILLALICILPIINVLATSLSSNTAVAGGKVAFWPVEFSLESYKYVLGKTAFWRSMGVTILRCILGVSVNVFLCVISAYPLSKSNKRFHGRTAYTWFFFLTMLINGGLIPTFMTVKSAGLLGSIWALILPGAVPVFSVVLMLNFFRAVPEELEEAAIVDGASQWQILMKIFIPISKASMATVCLFAIVFHWNSWFDGIIYINTPAQYPLQSYLNTVLIDATTATSAIDMDALALISDRTIKCAQIFLSMLPIMAAYPFLQRYFVKGMTLGSVKG
ncbi:carbohydrate ABC transporter permease [Novisyntrophococcus fermenticellae]|uniref:carbohydrate ABC transporter permease n=1 Tax=Novisyntrophococcus fermenticellae TaxID=2068655 RepID=UPI001E40E419|nr:carbohydrate ABC transporter permease [Novisyntrophococcus fermenticellae]